MVRSCPTTLGILALAATALLWASGLAHAEQTLSQVKITLSSGSILDGNVVYCQTESAEFLLEADANCYAFVFMVSPLGTVKLAFPNQGHPFNMIAPHQTVRIPDDGYYQNVGIRSGWAQFVVVASEDPSWAYSFNEFYPPKVWDAGQFPAWRGAINSSLVGAAEDEAANCRAGSFQGMSSEMRSELRDEIVRRGASEASESADLILARARVAVQGHRFAFAKQSFYVASSAYVSHTMAASRDHDVGPYGYSWYVYHDDLSLYGNWEFVVGFGYIWRPYHVSVSWAPYYHGRWVFTSYGWTWVSTEPWGWITCHYGHWAHTHRWGWVWLPGYVWGPARVVWYWSDGYVAWRPAPLPSDIRVSFEVHINEYPVTVVDRKHFTAEKVQTFAKIESLQAQGAALLARDGSRLERLSDPTPAHQRQLAPGPVKTLDVVPTAVDHAQGKTYGYYRVDKRQLYVPKPALAPATGPPTRFTAPLDPDRFRRRTRVVPKPEKPKPDKAEPDKRKPKKKPKKKVIPPKKEPKKPEPKEADKK